MKISPILHQHHAEVLVSSTSRDLPEHRKAAIDALWRSGMFPLSMERDPAMEDDPVTYSLALADQAEAYIGIFAYRYGYVPDGQDLSITEMELRRAQERAIPVLIFIMSPEHPIRGNDTESDPARLAKLIPSKRY